MLFFLPMTVRVRFAPSPTGHLHIGGARTALFNWLYARQKKGQFILRIEDTDVARSSTEMAEGIQEGMRWLGLDWDEETYYQSQRLEWYRTLCQRLWEEGHAYHCFCSREILESKKQAAQQKEGEWSYDQTCRHLSKTEQEAGLGAGRPSAMRLKVPVGERITVQDRVYGRITVESENIEDFVILRSDGMPTYHLSVVADDIDMGISDVIRGADHLSNTSKHVLLYQALGETVPRYAHLPLILGPDKKRLSKRHGTTSVIEYKRAGFLPAAIRNYLALLGWSPGCDQEMFGQSELIQLFDLGRINKANPVFDARKLEWMNGQYIRGLSGRELELEVKCLLEQEALWDEAWEKEERQWFLSTVDLLKSGTRTLADFGDFGRAFFTDQFEYEPRAVEKYLSSPEPLRAALEELSTSFDQLELFDLETTEKTVRKVAEDHEIKSGAFIGALRVALTGKAVAPGLFEVMTVLGREKTLFRLKRVLRFLQ